MPDTPHSEVKRGDERSRLKTMKPRLIAVFPTMLTLGNAACGFGAITLAAKLGPLDESGKGPMIAAAMVFLGMLFDMLDGSAARLTHQTSELGAQLDSLCDAITFGVAPAFLMLQFVTHQLGPIDASLPAWLTWSMHPRLLWTIGALYVVCAVLRLARFNVETEEEDSHEEFSGLPSPAAAGAVVAFPLVTPALLSAPEWAVWILPALKIILPLVTFGAACLMVSRIRYPHFFNQLFRGQKTRGHILQLIFTIAVVFWIHELAIPVIFCYFAFGSAVRAGWQRLLKLPRKPQLEPAASEHHDA